MSFDLESLLGGELQAKSGKIDTKTVKAKHIGLYFSAHWCPPCRGFTPDLANFYLSVKSKYGDDQLEIIFVSSDRDENSFQEYFDTMPWLCLPYENREAKEALAEKYNVRGIPKFVVLNGTNGNVHIENARTEVVSSKDNVGSFRWI